MANAPRALPRRAESLLDLRPEISPSSDAVLAAAPIQPVDFDSTAALSDAALRALARESPEPGARLAATWRIMLRGQALPKGTPGEGLRLLTLLNLATQQDLDLLAVLLHFDPSSAVRAQAAILLWRVARDRDRVVGWLVSRLGEDPSPDVVAQLLTLAPPLPFALIQDAACSCLGHPALDVRRAAWRYWLDNGGAMDDAVTAFLWLEPSRDLRAWCFDRWAEGPGHVEMLREGSRHPEAVEAMLASLFRAGRSFPLAELAPLLGRGSLESLLRVARQPFDEAERRWLEDLMGEDEDWAEDDEAWEREEDPQLTSS